jgi:deazaflavin-dependent oxidoreductase (nitroreductase family)
MAYRKPSFWVKNVFNRLAMRFGLGGARTLSVKRRRSGGAQEVPVLPYDHGGSRYLVSVRGEADWVKNTRAAGEVELRRKGGSERLRTVEVPTAERAPILAGYREKAGRAVSSHFDALPDPADHPVFRLEPRV